MEVTTNILDSVPRIDIYFLEIFWRENSNTNTKCTQVDVQDALNNVKREKNHLKQQTG